MAKCNQRARKGVSEVSHGSSPSANRSSPCLLYTSLRWYGTPNSGERVYVEIKKKYDGIVYKRRVGCSLTAAYAYLTGRVPYENACVQNPLSDQLQQDEALTLHSIQIAREIDAFAARYRNLRPSMYIVCERTAYAPVPGADADGLRITFDSGVAYRDVLALSLIHI